MEKYKGKYRIASARHPSWNYGNAAAYFITICTHNREHFFGEISNGEMHLNEIGKIAEQEWMNTLVVRPDMNLQLGEFVVMPNHFHGIVIIGENDFNTNGVNECGHGGGGIVNDDGGDNGDDGGDGDCGGYGYGIDGGDNGDDGGNGDCGGDGYGRDAMHRVSTSSGTVITSGMGISESSILNDHSINYKNQFGPQSKNLASIIRGFKSAVTTRAKMMNYETFKWQPRFHDHIIRDDQSFERIQHYIINNPLNWKEDKFF